MGCEFKMCHTFWKNTESLKVTGEPAPGSHLHGLPEKVEMGRGAWSPQKNTQMTLHRFFGIFIKSRVLTSPLIPKKVAWRVCV